MNSKYVVKANGESVKYDSRKIIDALIRSGSSMDQAQVIADTIEIELEDNSSTKSIFNKAFGLLKKNSKAAAGRFNLKKAIMQLGESGYPFENYVGELLNAEGYETSVGVIVQGMCVTHEVDVIATNSKEHLMCECKFHNKQGRFCNIKIPLYINSRFIDITNAYDRQQKERRVKHFGRIYTNTRFTSDAMDYARCASLSLIGWNYPEGNGLRERIDRTGVHPVTCLTSLNIKEKKALIDEGIVTCKGLITNQSVMIKLEISNLRTKRIINEAMEICKTDNHG